MEAAVQLPYSNIWSGLEPSVAVIPACIPMMQPLLGKRKYSATGTVKMKSVKRASLARQGSSSPSSKFELLDEDASTKEVSVSSSGRPSYRV